MRVWSGQESKPDIIIQRFIRTAHLPYAVHPVATRLPALPVQYQIVTIHRWRTVSRLPTLSPRRVCRCRIVRHFRGSQTSPENSTVLRFIVLLLWMVLFDVGDVPKTHVTPPVRLLPLIHHNVQHRFAHAHYARAYTITCYSLYGHFRPPPPSCLLG